MAMIISWRTLSFPRTTQKVMRTVAAAYSPSRKLDRLRSISGEEEEPPVQISKNPEADSQGYR